MNNFIEVIQNFIFIITPKDRINNKFKLLKEWHHTDFLTSIAVRLSFKLILYDHNKVI